MDVEMRVLVEKISDVLGGKVQIHASCGSVCHVIGGVDEVEYLIRDL